MGKIAKVLGGGSPPQDNSAADARQREEERQARILTGQENINNTFNSVFNDDFFNGITQTYTDFYNPQLTQQFEDAAETTQFALARQGINESTAGADRLSRLQERFDLQNTDITNRGLKAAADSRANVEQQRSSLFDLNNSSADPSLVASRASAAATGLQAPPALSPLGDVFASLINASNPIIAQQAQNVGFNNRAPGFSQPFGGSGTGRVIP